MQEECQVSWFIHLVGTTLSAFSANIQVRFSLGAYPLCRVCATRGFRGDRNAIL